MLNRQKTKQYAKDKRKSITREKVLSKIEERGYLLLHDGKIDYKTRFNIYCPIHDHIWSSIYANFNRPNGIKCPLCVVGTPSLKEVVDYIRDHNGTFVKKEINETVHYYIRCNIHTDHVWKTGWANLHNRGSWCKLCGWDRQIITNDKIRKAVEERDGTLLDDTCCGSLAPFEVMCNKDCCVWLTTWSIIKNDDGWCPECSNLVRYTYNMAKDVLISKGMQLLTPDEDGMMPVRRKITVKCKCGNVFSSLFGSLSRDDKDYCQNCCPYDTSTQKLLLDIVKVLFPLFDVTNNFRGFDWLIFKWPMEIDIWVAGIMLAIEYDGEQHFHAVKFDQKQSNASSKKQFKDQQKRDRKKNALIAAHPNEVKYFIRFNYKEPITKEYVTQKLIDAGVPVPKERTIK